MDKASTPDRVSVKSAHAFPETLDRLRTALTARGMTVFAEIDQSAAARSVGASLRPTVLVVFGNPRGGTPVMHAYPHAALELPLRVLVWEEEGGQVFLDYPDPAVALGLRHGVPQDLWKPLANGLAVVELAAGSLAL